jgi:hypothetical protein
MSAAIRAPNIAQNQIEKRRISDKFFAKNRAVKIFFVFPKRSEANNISKLGRRALA